jgi:hypothetical protein
MFTSSLVEKRVPPTLSPKKGRPPPTLHTPPKKPYPPYTPPINPTMVDGPLSRLGAHTFKSSSLRVSCSSRVPPFRNIRTFRFGFSIRTFPLDLWGAIHQFLRIILNSDS